MKRTAQAVIKESWLSGITLAPLALVWSVKAEIVGGEFGGPGIGSQGNPIRPEMFGLSRILSCTSAFNLDGGNIVAAAVSGEVIVWAVPTSQGMPTDHTPSPEGMGMLITVTGVK